MLSLTSVHLRENLRRRATTWQCSTMLFAASSRRVAAIWARGEARAGHVQGCVAATSEARCGPFCSHLGALEAGSRRVPPHVASDRLYLLHCRVAVARDLVVGEPGLDPLDDLGLVRVSLHGDPVLDANDEALAD